MEGAPCPDEACFELWPCFDGDHLRHAVTAESVKLQGIHELAFSEQGYGYVAPLAGADAPCQWRRTLMKWQLYEVADDEEKSCSVHNQ